MRPEWEALEKNMRVIPSFLQGKQPSGALIDQFGFHVHCGGMLTLSVAVCGWNGGPGGERGTKHTCRVHIDNKRHSTEDERPEPLTEAEVAEITALITAAGLTVKEQWEGPGEWVSWGCTFPEIHPSLKQSRKRYHDACPKPGHSVFCGERATWGLTSWENGEVVKREPTDREREMIECTWTHGFAEAVPPAWTAVPWPVPSGGGDTQTQTNRHLDEVLAALAVLRPIVEDVGIVPSTLVPGRRGRVEDDEFVDEEGLAVAIPAEAAVRIAQLLQAAIDLGAI